MALLRVAHAARTRPPPSSHASAGLVSGRVARRWAGGRRSVVAFSATSAASGSVAASVAAIAAASATARAAASVRRYTSAPGGDGPKEASEWTELRDRDGRAWRSDDIMRESRFQELTTEVMQPGDHPHSLLITMAEDFGVDPSSVPDVVDFLRNLDARTIDSYRQEKQEEFAGLVASLSQTPTDVMVAVGVATVREADDTEGEHAKTLAAAVAAIPELHDLNPQAVLKSAAAEGIDVGPEVDVAVALPVVIEWIKLLSADELFAVSRHMNLPAPEAFFDGFDADALRRAAESENRAMIAAKEARREAEKAKEAAYAAIRAAKTVDAHGRMYATGRRKTSTARVWIKPSDSFKFNINRVPLHDYFGRLSLREDVIAPFVATKTVGDYEVVCTVKGGGNTGQAGAVRHGLATALQLMQPELRTTLKRAGFLRRDPRMVERKKAGRKKARKSFPHVKR